MLGIPAQTHTPVVLGIAKVISIGRYGAAKYIH